MRGVYVGVYSSRVVLFFVISPQRPSLSSLCFPNSPQAVLFLLPPAMISKDRDALIALFHSTGGESWRHTSNWSTGADLSQWHGVKVNVHGHVVELRLPDNNLRGTALGSTADAGYSL